MRCPNNHESFEEVAVGGVKINRCSQCGGLWFKREELRLAKDAEVPFAKWFDFDLWDKKEQFAPSESQKSCPVDQIQMFKVKYEGAAIEIDVCKKCFGVWLDKDEFKGIV